MFDSLRSMWTAAVQWWYNKSSVVSTLDEAVFEAHTAAIQCIVECVFEVDETDESDQMWFLTGARDCTIKLWSVAGREIDYLITYKGHSGSVRSLAIVGETDKFVSASEDGTLKLWRFDKKWPIATFWWRGDIEDSRTHYTPTSFVSLSEDTFMCGTPDAPVYVRGEEWSRGNPILTFRNYVKVWSIANPSLWTYFTDILGLKRQECARKITVPNGLIYVQSIAAIDEQNILCGHGNGDVSRLNLPDESFGRVKKGHTGGVDSIILLPGKKTMFITFSKEDGSIRKWSLKEKSAMWVVTPQLTSGVCCIALVNDKYFASSESDGSVRLRDLASGRSVALVLKGAGIAATSLACIDSRMIVAGDESGTAHVLEIDFSSIEDEKQHDSIEDPLRVAVENVASQFYSAKWNADIGTYGDLVRVQVEALSELVKSLAAEFANLLKIDDAALIRKAVAVQFDGSYEEKYKGRKIDFSRVNDQVQDQVDLARLAIRIWSDLKNNTCPLDSDQDQDSMLYRTGMGSGMTFTIPEKNRVSEEGAKTRGPELAAMKDGVNGLLSLRGTDRPDLPHLDGGLKDANEAVTIRNKEHPGYWKVDKHTLVCGTPLLYYRRVFKGLVTWIAEEAGVAEDVGLQEVEINWKSLQSIFNKGYIRRGQCSVDIVSDVLRATLVCEDKDTLRSIFKVLRGRNVPKYVDKKSMDLIGFFECIEKLQPIIVPLNEANLPNRKNERVIPYRFKANSSQKGLEEEDAELFNLNFFVRHPLCYQVGRFNAVVGFELQIGLKETMKRNKKDHVPYERRRILEALPVLKSGLEAADSFSDDVNYDELNATLCIEGLSNGSTKPIEFTEQKVIRWKDGSSLSHPVINDSQFRDLIGDWEDPASPCIWGAEHHAHPQSRVVWTHPISTSKRYQLVDVRLHISPLPYTKRVIVGLTCRVGPYAFLMSARDILYSAADALFATCEVNGLGDVAKVELVKSGFNFFTFGNDTLLPKGADMLEIVVPGNLEHSFTSIEINLLEIDTM